MNDLKCSVAPLCERLSTPSCVVTPSGALKKPWWIAGIPGALWNDGSRIRANVSVLSTPAASSRAGSSNASM